MAEVIKLPKVKIQSSKEFSKDWRPPTYLVDGVFQKRYVYAITASAGTGKTAIALTLAAHVALGLSLGERMVEQGRVLYFAGENPDDIRTRWLLLAEAMGFDTAKVSVDFIAGAFPIEALISEVQSAAREKGPYDLVIVDTSAAYFSGDDDNNNVEMQRHAATLRGLVNLHGGPCVVVCCHPPKKGGQEPRGGSAFLNEIDGNTYLVRKDNLVSLKQHQKFRGPDFSPLTFELVHVKSAKRVDARNRPIMSVRAIAAVDNSQGESGLSEQILFALIESPGGSLRDIASAIGEPDPQTKGKSKVNRELQKLKAAGLAETGINRRWRLTQKGEETIELLSPRPLKEPFAA